MAVKRGHMGDQEVGLHLFSTGGLLEDSWWNRTFWMYAKIWPGYQMAHIASKAVHKAPAVADLRNLRLSVLNGK